MKQLLATLFLIAGLAATLCAQPAYLNYQGRLSDAAGAPLDNGTYSLEFNIYDAANGVNKVWGPFLFDGNGGNGHAPRVVVVQGRFNVILGPVDTAARALQDAFAGTNRFVEIKVDGGAPITPRQQFLSSPYAFRAFNADTAGLAASATVANSVTDANVAYRNAANTFTANQTVTGNVTASGNVTADGKGVAVGEENLRIVRGSVAANGSTIAGSGFTATSPNPVGIYTITFNPAFAGIPTVTASSSRPAQVASPYLVTANSFTVTLHVPTVGNGNDPFSFIAIGPR